MALAARVIVVTGAGGGIGRAAVLTCVERGARVLAADRNKQSVEQTVELANRMPADGRVAAVSCEVDVTDEDSVQNMIRCCVQHFGRVDCALNAAGIEGGRCELHKMSVDNFDSVMNVNTKGVFLCMRAQLTQMLEQLPPSPLLDIASSLREAKVARTDKPPIDTLNYSIVNLASTAAQASMPEFAAYSASKHAILGLTRTAAKEYATKGIRVNALCPSTTDTPMVQRFAEQWPEWQAKQNASFPVGRIGRAEEGEPPTILCVFCVRPVVSHSSRVALAVAEMVVFLFSAACPMMSGACLTIDGALTS